MQKRKLGNTDIYLSELGYGCASLWGKTKFISEEEAMLLFKKAYNCGITFFDTGHSYGIAEKRLGQCIKELGAADRENITISTKCGTRSSSTGGYHDWSLDWMKYSVEISMKRLNVNYIDMLQLHGPKVNEISDEILKWMNSLKSEGIVHAIGINTFDTDVLEYVCKNKLFDFVMLDYNILRQDREEIIEDLYNNGIGVIAGAPLAQSLYSTRIYKIRNLKDVWYFLRASKNFREQMKYGRQFRFINNVEGYKGSQLALKYVLDNTRISSAVFGTVDIEHLAENVASADIEIPSNIRAKIVNCRKAGYHKLDRK